MRSLPFVVALAPLLAAADAGAQARDHRSSDSPDVVDVPPWWSRLYLRPTALHVIDGFRYPAHTLDPIALFMADQEISDAAYSVDQGTWTTGIERMQVAQGSNEHHISAAGTAGWQSGDVTATASGPISRDHAWFFGGVAPRMDGSWSAIPWAASVSFAVDPEMMGTAWATGAATEGVTSTVFGAALDEPVAFSQFGAVAGHSWRFRLHDYRTEVRLGVGASKERIEIETTAMPQTVTDDRAAFRGVLVRRVRLGGNHQLSAGFDSALGSANDTVRMRSLDTAEMSLYAGDSWQLLPNLTIDAGTRWDSQLAGRGGSDERLEQWSPRAGAIWDWTREGRSKLYAHWGRYFRPATLDAPNAETIDEAIAGAEYEVVENISVGVAGVHRTDHHSVRVNATSRSRWLRGSLLYDSHLGLDLRAGAQLSFLSPYLVASARIHTAARVPSSIRLEYYTLLFDQKVRWFSDVLVDEAAPDVRLGLRADW